MARRSHSTTDDRPYEEWRALNAGTLAACYSSIETAKRCWDLVDALHPDPDQRRAYFAKVDAEMEGLDLAGRNAVYARHIAALQQALGIAPAAPADPAHPPKAEAEAEARPVWHLARVLNHKRVRASQFVQYHTYPVRRVNSHWVLVNPQKREAVALAPVNAARSLQAVRDRYGEVMRADAGLAATAEEIAEALRLLE